MSTQSDAKAETVGLEKAARTTINISLIISLIVGFVAVIAMSVATTLLVLERANMLRSKEIVSVDAADMIVGFLRSQDPDISSEDLAERARALNARLDMVIPAFARDRNVVVLNSAATLGGTRDVTVELLTDLGVVQ